MATVQIADKSTLDNVATNVTYIKNNMPSGGGGTPKIVIFNTDSQYTGVTFTISNEEIGFEQSVTMSGSKAEVELPYLGEYTVSATIAGSILINRSVNVTTAATIIYDPNFLEIKAFASCTDEELIQLINAHYADLIDISDYWAVGDKRTATLSAMSGLETQSSQDVELAIADFDHDDLVKPINGHSKAAITLAQVNGLTTTGVMNSNRTNSMSWGGSNRRSWCNNVYYNALPPILQSNVKPVKKITAQTYNGSTNQETEDYCWLFAPKEVLGGTATSAGTATGYSNLTEFNALTQYPYYSTSTNRIKKPGASGSATYWWERSPYYSNSTHFCNINSSGTYYYGYANTAYLLAPAFCI